jgi:hypothetical protein
MEIQATTEEEEEIPSNEADLPISLHHNLHINNRLNLLLKEIFRDLTIKFVGSKDTMLLTITT